MGDPVSWPSRGSRRTGLEVAWAASQRGGENSSWASVSTPLPNVQAEVCHGGNSGGDGGIVTVVTRSRTVIELHRPQRALQVAGDE
jgi:hypothetical protein